MYEGTHMYQVSKINVCGTYMYRILINLFIFIFILQQHITGMYRTTVCALQTTVQRFAHNTQRPQNVEFLPTRVHKPFLKQ